MVFPTEDVPEELVIDFDSTQPGSAGQTASQDTSKRGAAEQLAGAGGSDRARSGRVTFRLQPSSLSDGELIYVEVFDE